MKIGPDQALAVAELARLDLPPEEAAEIGAQLSAILDHFAELSALDTEGVPPTSHALPLSAALRADELAEPSAGTSALLEQAPQSADGYFVVPKVID